MKTSLLIVDDDAFFSSLLKLTLSPYCHKIKTIGISHPELYKIIIDFNPEVIVFDHGTNGIVSPVLKGRKGKLPALISLSNSDEKIQFDDDIQYISLRKDLSGIRSLKLILDPEFTAGIADYAYCNKNETRKIIP